MGHWEDFWYETHQTLTDLGLQKDFDKQLKKMHTQDKHKYKDTRTRWEYALTKVLDKHYNRKRKQPA
jgi:hypothetical protein